MADEEAAEAAEAVEEEADGQFECTLLAYYIYRYK